MWKSHEINIPIKFIKINDGFNKLSAPDSLKSNKLKDWIEKNKILKKFIVHCEDCTKYTN